MALSGRAEILLKTLIERYIADGQPVGSRVLAKYAGLDLSPATIRNVMADLEDLGLVRSPHTSAGRVPTQLGYRLFVDSLLTVRPFEDREWHRLAQDLSADQQPERLLESASMLLSQVTRMTGMVRTPRRAQASFRHLEFLSLSPQRLLAILVTQDGRVHNRIVQSDRVYSPAELTQVGNYFNETYAGMPLNEVKVALRDSLKRDGEDLQRVVQAAVAMANQVVDDEETDNVVMSGESNLFDMPDLDTGRLRQLLETFNTKRGLLQLLDQSMCAGGVQIFIGSESGYKVLEDCSVVAAPYQVDGRIVGTLGVIGPTRMPYQHVISIVDMTARLLSGALSGDSRTLCAGGSS